MKQTLMYRNGLHLSYAEFGDKSGYPILVQHGLIASIDDDHLFNRLLRANLRVICVARPGYGESSPYVMSSFAEWADLLAPLIEKLELQQFDVLGMSSGAPYSYSIGYRFPGKVRNIYIFSGTPVLYDDIVLSHWPYQAIKNKPMDDVEKLAHELFFADLSQDDLRRNDIRDSTMHHGFGVAQDLILRFVDWGFSLSEVEERVFMRHSKCDDAVPFATAVRTAELLPNCQLELTERGPHFSPEALDDFIERVVLANIEP